MKLVYCDIVGYNKRINFDMRTKNLKEKNTISEKRARKEMRDRLEENNGQAKSFGKFKILACETSQ